MPTRTHHSNGSVTVDGREIAFKAGVPFEVNAAEAALLDQEGFTAPDEPKTRKKGSEPDTQEPTP